MVVKPNRKGMASVLLLPIPLQCHMGFTQLWEVVSLDRILWASVFQDMIAEDWQHNVQKNFKTNLFHNIDEQA